MLPDDQAALLPEDIRGNPAIQSFNDFGGLAKSYIDTKAMVGNSVRLPGKDAKPEDIEGLFNRLEVRPPDSWLRKMRDVPEKAADYEYVKPADMPEGAQWSEELVGRARDLAHKLGWSKQDFTEALNFHNALIGELMQKGADAQRVSEMDAEQGWKQKQQDWGADFEKNKMLATDAVKAIFSKNPKALAKFDEFNLSNDPDIVEVFLQMGKMMQQDQMPNFKLNVGGPSSLDEIDTAINDIRMNKDMDNEEKGRRLMPLYEKKAAMMKRAS